MKILEDISSEEAKILSKLRDCLARIQKVIQPGFTDIPSGIALLRLLRSGSAEDINQLQHAALALVAARHIQKEQPETEKFKWYWNPYQTGGIDEPDLRVMKGSRIVLSAEVTASEKPVGVIDTRMAHTLKKLASMPGDLFYFVRTDTMLRRAKTKIKTAGYSITATSIKEAEPVRPANAATRRG